MTIKNKGLNKLFHVPIFRLAATVMKLELFDTVSVEKLYGAMKPGFGSDSQYFEIYKIW